MKVDQRRSNVLVVDDLFGLDEMSALMAAVELATFERQEIGRGILPSRGRQRAVVDDVRIGDLLWSKLAPLLAPISSWFGGPGTPRLDPSIDQWSTTGCNSRSRFYRYGLGGSFSEHEDEPWKPDRFTRSMLTVLVYLPMGGCVGGETVVDGEVVSVVDGRVVVFEHGLLHEGKPIERGQKLVLRNDVVATSPAERS